tara:strand:- start:37 stop:1059 length:1023 start_codon:yes stop_codon:yes gene_type:complete
MVPPNGGEKDTLPPSLIDISIDMNEKEPYQKIISFKFDEFIVLNNWEENFYISPPIQKRIQKKIKATTLILTIEDTLTENITYQLALNNCIKDLNEGNILDTLEYIFSNSDDLDTLTLSGRLQDAYTLGAVENAWVMLFDEIKNDTAIFKGNPNYIAKTDKEGNFNFPNLNTNNYTIVALTDFDFIYNEKEKIAFNTNVNAEKDSFVSLLAFDPILEIDSVVGSTTIINTDSIKTDSLFFEEIVYGNLAIITSKNSPCVFQLLQKNKVIKEWHFIEQPFLLTDIVPAKYQLKFIEDTDQNGEWTTGNWKNKTAPERVYNYGTEITIRSNWDLELEWTIEE